MYIKLQIKRPHIMRAALKFFLHVSYYDTAMLADVAGLVTHIGAVF